MSLRQQHSREMNGLHYRLFCAERYWEQQYLVWYIKKPRNPKESVCVHRSGRTVKKGHSFDKDGRCIFCDWLKP